MRRTLQLQFEKPEKILHNKVHARTMCLANRYQQYFLPKKLQKSNLLLASFVLAKFFMRPVRKTEIGENCIENSELLRVVLDYSKPRAQISSSLNKKGPCSFKTF